MSLDKKSLKIALDIISSEVHELSYLAKLTGLDIFTFYRGADLSALDLSGQDLRGLNFEGADIRFSSLKHSMFDAGAFNGCVIDDGQSYLQDEYVFYFIDIASANINDILLFCKFRKGIVDDCISTMKLSYRAFSDLALVSENALRKARAGQIVALETAQNIVKFIINIFDSEPERFSDIKQKIKQPSIEYLSGGNNGPFKHVSRELLDRMMEIRRARIASNPNHPHISYRDTIEYLEIMHTISTI